MFIIATRIARAYSGRPATKVSRNMALISKYEWMNDNFI